MAAATSCDDSGANSVNVMPGGARRNLGGAESDVVDLIRSTLSAKKVDRSSAETPSQARHAGDGHFKHML